MSDSEKCDAYGYCWECGQPAEECECESGDADDTEPQKVDDEP